MNLFEFIDKHPFLTFFLVVVVLAFIHDIVLACRRR